MTRLILPLIALFALAGDASAFGGRCCGTRGGASTCGAGLFRGGVIQRVFHGPIITRIQERHQNHTQAQAPCACGEGCICQPAGACGGANCRGYQCGPFATQPNVPATNPGAYWVAPWCDEKGCHPGGWVNPPINPPQNPPPKAMPKGLDFENEQEILADNPNFVDFDF